MPGPGKSGPATGPLVFLVMGQEPALEYKCSLSRGARVEGRKVGQGPALGLYLSQTCAGHALCVDSMSKPAMRPQLSMTWGMSVLSHNF